MDSLEMDSVTESRGFCGRGGGGAYPPGWIPNEYLALACIGLEDESG